MWPRQVIARIEGGLGNQLFQYAAARSLADRLNCELALDLRGLAENGDRPYQLDLYKTRCVIADTALLDRLPPWRSSRASRVRSRIAQCLPDIYSYPVFWPNDFSYDPRFDCIKRPVFMVGYWQTEKYFSWNRSHLLQDLQLRVPLNPRHSVLTRMSSVNSAALHVRRGDYVSNPAAAEFHGTCDTAYYMQAVAELKNRQTDVELFVFSDEPEWARANLKFDVPTHVVDCHTPEQGHLDLELMRHCQHHIIANSSFSWWGAWLCESSGQHVYAPQRWFQDAGTNTSDVIPPRWHIVGAERGRTGTHI
ncbi:alpha-1,2-fucosyltransferase [Rhodoferax mekongensis]|uniref:Alpha-1,2-fucosyltransferase n=1 Tax=Rhodoferax mekongensis TaxID=3068341 RepID=A0ABZ0AVP0_9BURK|nr:alpha-1,2-fucosyltransferase [Rhodoferax sp. TBRC 17307]WNO03726.1 alpha-1,2-fucosyltransferase [Rhodoferax sp. TBRC 17307]